MTTRRAHDLMRVSDSAMKWRDHTFMTALESDRNLCLVAHAHTWLHPQDDYVALIRDLESQDLVVVELVGAGRRQVAPGDEDPAADERLGGFAAVGALEGDQHETASKGRRREHGYLVPCASGRFEEDRPSRHQARRGWVVGPHADNTPQSVCRHHLADRDHLGLTFLR